MTTPPTDLPPLVLSTRPAHQAGPLEQTLRDSGFQVLAFPTIEIVAAAPGPQLDSLAGRIGEYDCALFVSRNAVDHAMRVVAPVQWPSSVRLGVIGKGTSKALARHGLAATINPTGSFNSEGLLAAPALQRIGGMRVVIFRGQQGRNLLGDTLRERGAQVTYVEVYRRALPSYPAGYFNRLTAERFPQIAVFTSAEGLRNCFEMIDPDAAARMRGIPWVLISDRMRETARDLGHNDDIVIAPQASDAGIQNALHDWRNNNHQAHP
jgi:uroporphyrinogen-III synthase